MRKKIILLGSTGSIGTQCLDVCKKQNFEVVAIVANHSVELLEEQAREFNPKIVAVFDETKYNDLKNRLSDLSVKVMAGEKAILEISEMPADIVVNAITGIAGLLPTLSALKAGNNVALANKEALVTGGKLIMDIVKQNQVDLFPIDSEHSAIWQSMRSGNRSEVKKILLTASGGPFYGRTRQQLENVSVKEALAHPNWSMGSKISIDSATLMNKGLEFIEAIWLFDLNPEQIEVLIHRQSVIHSAVEFIDGSVIAQMGVPDMRVPIQYALSYPSRLPLDTKPFSLTDFGSLTFAKPDYETFGCLQICIEAAKKGGLYPCLVNAANEKAVELFISEKIKFIDIENLVKKAFLTIDPPKEITIENITQLDGEVRDFLTAQFKNVGEIL